AYRVDGRHGARAVRGDELGGAEVCEIIQPYKCYLTSEGPCKEYLCANQGGAMARRSTVLCAVLLGLSLPCAAAEVTLKAVTVFSRHHVFNAPVFEVLEQADATGKGGL